jgi:uncharacterized protein YcbK (DUF882 family)
MLLGCGLSPSSTESAVANGDTRTIVLTSDHTKESGSFTYMVDGAYDQATLDKLNWFLRDWRLNEPTKMDPKLFDIVWEVYRESGSKQPIDVLSAYRSPQTNAMLRRRSRQVAKYSQHMEGKAMDAHFQDVDTATIRNIAMRMEAGGVGFYPSGYTPWVHIDSGDVRYWPRMNRDALARLFPDGKTVFIPSDGQPMPGYDQARAEIESRGGEVQVAHSDSNAHGGGGGLFSWLFGAKAGGADDEEEASGGEGATRGHAPPPAPAAAQVAKADAPQPAPAAVAEAPDSADTVPADSNDGDFPAPLPPRKPVELILAAAPTPPARPTELAFAPAADTSGDRGLIAALLTRGGLPAVITRGVGAPRGLLALTEAVAPEPPERPAILDRAAALAAPLPPLPPTRIPARVAAKPAPNETSAATPAKLATNTPAPAPTARGLALLSPPPSANPYGAVVTDGFAAVATPSSLTATAELRGATP